MSNNERHVSVFIQPGRCVQCEAVMRKFSAAKIDYSVGELGQPSAERYTELAKAAGYSSAPVVVMEEYDSQTGDSNVVKVFGGYNPTLVKEAIEYVR